MDTQRWFPVVLAVLGLLVVGCGGSDPDDTSGALCAGTDYILPSSTLRDLVTYADQVAVVEVVDESELRGDGPDAGLYREVTIGVRDVVWQAPQRRTVPDETTYITEGWIDRDPDKGPVAPCDQPAMTVGQTYVVGLVEYSSGEWAPMGGPFVLDVDDGHLSGTVDDGPLAAFHGRTPTDLGRALAVVEPDPAVAPYRYLPGGERDQAAAGGG